MRFHRLRGKKGTRCIRPAAVRRDANYDESVALLAFESFHAKLDIKVSNLREQYCSLYQDLNASEKICKILLYSIFYNRLKNSVTNKSTTNVQKL